MKIIDQFRVVFDALAIGAYCRGAGRELPFAKNDFAALCDDIDPVLEGPWRDMQALIHGTAAIAVSAALAEMERRGLAAVAAADRAELVGRLPAIVMRDATIEIEIGPPPTNAGETGESGGVH